jgi:hypothetical protein
LEYMSKFAISIAITMQFLAVAVLLFGSIGFDHPGPYGLDFEDGILIVAVYVVALGFGVIVCIGVRKWIPLFVQAVVPMLFTYSIFAPTPNPKLAVNAYQHLVGKSKDDVHEELQAFRRWRSGFGGSDFLEFESYNGIDIYYSQAGRVVQVTANDEIGEP